VQALVEEFVQRGQLSSDEGLRMVERMVARGRQEAQTVLKKADSSLQTAYKDVGLASRNELEDFDFRIRQLEHRVRLLEQSSDEQKT
jgi:polyhydroxyalkanoate synthesis regulator phasin